MNDDPLLLMLKAADRTIGINTAYAAYLKLRLSDNFHASLVRLIEAGRVTLSEGMLAVTKPQTVLDALSKGPLSPEEICEQCYGSGDELRQEVWDLIGAGRAALTPDLKIERIT